MNLQELLDSYPSYNRKNLTFIQTCGACPEQYEVYKGKKPVGYLRLRHGYFYASTEVGGKVLYEAEPKGDGVFEDSERDFYLDNAADAILKNIQESQ